MRRYRYTLAEKKAFASGCRVGARNAKKSAYRRTSKYSKRRIY